MIISQDNEKKLSALAESLKENITIKDRTHRFRTYPSTFLGRDALAWFIESKNASSMVEAKQLGNILISAGYFHHVHDEHTLKDDILYYRFYEDEKKGKKTGETKDELSVTQQVALLELQLNEKNVELSSIYERLQRIEENNWSLKDSIIHANFFINIFTYAISVMGLCLLYLLFNGYIFFLFLLLMAPFVFKTTIAISILSTVYSYLGYDMTKKRATSNDKKTKIKTLGNKLGSKRISEILQNVTLGDDDGSESNDMHAAAYFAANPTVDAFTIDRYTQQHLTIGDGRRAMEIETNLFKGKIILSLRGNKRLDRGSIAQRGYFEGRNRISACFVQGKFKQSIPFNEVLTGQSFTKKLSNLPSAFLIQMLFGVLNRISPNMVNDVTCPKPYLLTPLIAAAQTVHICKPGERPPDLSDIFSRDLSDHDLEDCSSLFPPNKKKMKYTQRRKYFNDMKNMEGLSFDTENTYTFGFWQDIFDSTKFMAILPFGSYDVTKYMNQQPMQIMSKVGVKGEYVWCVEMWHRKLFEGNRRDSETN
jgi:hypothetical protein